MRERCEYESGASDNNPSPRKSKVHTPAKVTAAHLKFNFKYFGNVPKTNIEYIMKLRIIALTICEWIAVLFAAKFALQDFNIVSDTITAMLCLGVAGVFEYLKHIIKED